MQSISQMKRRIGVLYSLGEIVGAMKSMSSGLAGGWDKSARALEAYLRNVELGI